LQELFNHINTEAHLSIHAKLGLEEDSNQDFSSAPLEVGARLILKYGEVLSKRVVPWFSTTISCSTCRREELVFEGDFKPRVAQLICLTSKYLAISQALSMLLESGVEKAMNFHLRIEQIVA